MSMPPLRLILDSLSSAVLTRRTGEALDIAAKARTALSMSHEHEWRPAGVTPVGNAGGSVYIWAMCGCGEIEPRQWDF